MFPINLLTTLLLALSVVANPLLVKRSPVTLPISRRVNITSVNSLLKHDQVRAQTLLAGALTTVENLLHEADAVSEQLENQAVSYVASVGIGSPATTYELLLDTGSSNTWIGANKAYTQTQTSSKTPNSFAVSYGSGSCSGDEYTDQLTIVPGFTVDKQLLGVASQAQGFKDVDGILGLGPVGLTLGSLSPATGDTVPTVTDNLFSQGLIPTNAIGISFEPTNSEKEFNGAINWGSIDTSKFTGDLTYIPITTVSPASHYWGIDQAITYGESTPILDTAAGIVDTGTTLILVATDAFNKYKDAVGAVLDQQTGLLTINPAQYASLQSLYFKAGGNSFELTPNAQIWPRALNNDIGGTSDKIYLVIADLGAKSGSGFDFINGYAFLERFYSVFDTTNKRVGLATTPFTQATSN
ncbi:hypothetical protein CVT26_005352 [Gymnopilus dilepis]|uniref:Peptidase A1 domain-containing protein n=1 Tax=Gymnopilus dilepis TaxID=231916 RepID=A0A409YT03_9AGAR|nr:hypothetical protein CVT26_005352 [Gymnopilus dilepis]